MINFSQVYEGWRNKIIPPKELREQIQTVSAIRAEICNDCPHHSKHHDTLRVDDHCTDCGCTLSAKQACLSCECPKSYWKAEVTQEQETEIKQSYVEGI